MTNVASHRELAPREMKNPAAYAAGFIMSSRIDLESAEFFLL